MTRLHQRLLGWLTPDTTPAIDTQPLRTVTWSAAASAQLRQLTDSYLSDTGGPLFGLRIEDQLQVLHLGRSSYCISSEPDPAYLLGIADTLRTTMPEAEWCGWWTMSVDRQLGSATPLPTVAHGVDLYHCTFGFEDGQLTTCVTWFDGHRQQQLVQQL